MSANTTRFTGRTALITGSTAGLGVAIAHAFAAAGAHVIVTGRDAERGGAVVADIGARGGRARFVAADLAAGESAVRDLVTAAGDVDILVNNAGIWSTPEPTEQISEATLLASYWANVIAPFLLTGALAPRMARRGHGAIVNIGSITGFIGGDKSALYNSTKAAVHSLTKSWAAEYGPAGVRVNAVAPGPIATERAAESADHVAPVLARIPSRRMSTPDEVAAAVLFLASDEAANIHGAVLSVDGGWAAT
ncbi:glucose 1-dehydrogenase [Mycolicibacterium neoaurum]|uniref:SDR family NAD(P)-dependent oxidoreductase n=1 Tax=Mycolicibacterium neoaurum TaxID=1795 RepID=UPI001BCB784E|nr:glucose 1-dehydrogenase [Mycolicibacterium neoaurum]QVI29590.1 glucose 1-dehydrogenase [Mycolicibacterium neoaurum]